MHDWIFQNENCRICNAQKLRIEWVKTSGKEAHINWGWEEKWARGYQTEFLLNPHTPFLEDIQWHTPEAGLKKNIIMVLMIKINVETWVRERKGLGWGLEVNGVEHTPSFKNILA